MDGEKRDKRTTETKRDSSEQVLIERDGKFELVSATDMQANDNNVPVSGQGNKSSLDSAAALGKDTVTKSDGQNSDDAQKTESLTEPKAQTQPDEKAENKDKDEYLDNKPVDNLSEIFPQNESHEKTDAATKNPLSQDPQPPKTPSTTLQSDSKQEGIAEAEHIHPPEPKSSSESSSEQEKENEQKANLMSTLSATALKQRRKVKRITSMGRTKSAPGFRIQSRDQEEEERERRERNEAAFSAWRARKDKEIAEMKRQDVLKHKYDSEQKEERRSRNEAAFQAWLTYKNEQILQEKKQERLSRPTTSIPKENEERSRAAFKVWLDKKQSETQCAIELRQKQREQEEEAAKKADPTIVEQAYKRLANQFHACCMGDI